ncbi:hypothetical protein DIS24_g11507 [Lasiodiplodia hormozganensis]|uniref:Acyl-coenzyme A thioesterase 8 n=1 Tax=Lasiodiplodia hormozganensis TaxID=869390 RepID=A0AA39WNS0_9PEZI|nr:hypothetical protein DIS24_g11507 [Lasiodiplodia hormozganensis]
MASTLLQQISVDDLGSDEFISCFNPERMGNAQNIGYGGCTLGVAIQAACHTVPSSYLLYSATGNYLGPSLTDRKLRCSVQRVRDTRTFATRLVRLSQEQDDGSTRLCMIILADFQTKEDASMLVYSAPPDKSYSPPEQCPSRMEATEEMVRSGTVSRKMADIYEVTFGLLERFVECRGAPEGVASNKLLGVAKKAATPQDGDALTSKTSGDWFRCRHPLGQQQDHYAALGFILDGALSFMPLTHSDMFLDDAGACSSLDFALRFFTNSLNLDQWHLREIKTVTGGEGRTYTEARLWDEEGNMVANMTQQSILRPPRLTVRAAL